MPALFLLVNLAMAAQVDTAPITPALNGRVECLSPDMRRRTCRSMSSYWANRDGTYGMREVVLISRDGPLTLDYTLPVVLESRRVCGVLHAQDITNGTLRIGTGLVAGFDAALTLAQIAQRKASRLNKQICTEHVLTLGRFVQKSYVDGVYKKAEDEPLIWVAPDDGYRVAP